MDLNFCKNYTGDCSTTSNKYCRKCSKSKLACDQLWQLVVDLSNFNKGEPVNLTGTNAKLLPNPNNWNIVRLEVKSRWNLPKEDFLHFIATGSSKSGNKNQRLDPKTSPSLTRQEPYVQSIVKHLGGANIPEITAVKSVQAGNESL